MTTLTTELRQVRSSHLAMKEELLRSRQEKESVSKESFRLECALRKSNDSIVSLQQQLSEATERATSLAQQLDDSRRSLRLLESQSIDREDRLRQATLALEVASRVP